MASLFAKVNEYLKANGKTWEEEDNNIMLENYSDGQGDIITSWNVSGLEQPTAEQLATYEADGNTAESNSLVFKERRQNYGTWGEQLDEIYHDIDAWKARLLSIKNSNPKT